MRSKEELGHCRAGGGFEVPEAAPPRRKPVRRCEMTCPRSHSSRLATWLGPDSKSRDSPPSAYLQAPEVRSLTVLWRFRSGHTWALESLEGAREGGRACPLPPERREGSRAAGEGTSGGGVRNQPCPRGQAGAGSQEQCLPSAACQPRGRARGWSPEPRGDPVCAAPWKEALRGEAGERSSRLSPGSPGSIGDMQDVVVFCEGSIWKQS